MASAPEVAASALDDDDLSVLPGRRRSRALSGRNKYAFALLGLLLLGGALVVGLGAPGGDDVEAVVNGVSPTGAMGALPPPPPSAEDLPPVLEPAEPSPAPRTSRPSETSDELESEESYGLGGPSVRRYADVPSPTLSRLAREQRRLARERDEAMREK